jgi:hypothetical protein
LFHLSNVGGLPANKPAIVMIAKGKPSHFFKTSSETSVRCDGHASSEPNILFKNNRLEFTILRGRIVYMGPRCEEQQDSATSFTRVVVMILLPQLFFVKSYLMVSHDFKSHKSSTTIKYLPN